MESDDDDDDDGPMVSVGSRRVPYNSVSSDMAAMMTPLEREEYIRIGQQLYENMYDWWMYMYVSCAFLDNYDCICTYVCF